MSSAESAVVAYGCCCISIFQRICCCKDSRVRNLKPLKLDKENFEYPFLSNGTADAAKPVRSWEEGKGLVNLGAAAPNIISVLFQNLLNRSYGFLLSFIIIGLVSITLIFWIPFIVIVLNDPTAVENASTILDALAYAFAALFSVDTHYRAASAAAVFAVTIETVVGKLAITALTALLVLKISKVPDNCIQTKRVLIHKLKGQWTISIRVAILYDQRIWDPKMYLSCIANTDNGWMPATLEWSNHCLGHGFGRLDKLPMNLRHVVDEKSPLRNVDFENEEEVRKNINCFIYVVQGFDNVTGRSIGHEQRYDWKGPGDGRGEIFYAPEGQMGDVLVNKKLLKEYYGASWRDEAGPIGGVDWRMFNMIKIPKKQKVVAGDGVDLESGGATSSNKYAIVDSKIDK
jgi:hypothetical protein